MRFEIKVSGARQIGKTTIMMKILDLLEKEATHHNYRYVERLKPSIQDGVPTETVVIDITTFGEVCARSALTQQKHLTPEEFAREYPY